MGRGDRPAPAGRCTRSSSFAARRGIGLTVAGLAATLGRSAGAGVSSACIQATVKAAAQMGTTAMRIAIVEVVSTTAAALVRTSLRGMLLGELKTLASVAMVLGLLSCLAWVVAAPGQAAGRVGGAMPKPRDVPALVPAQAKADKPNDPKEMITYQGRVVDPKGRPFQGEALYLNAHGLKQVKKPPVRATSRADGRFRFTVSRSEFDTSEVESPWSDGTVEARAKDYAIGIANLLGDAKELSLQLARDDVPVSGRIIDLEGRPVAGVTVKVLNIRSTANGSLDDWLKAIDERKELYNLEHEFFPNRLERQTIPSLIPDALSGVDGAFHIKGVGRERVATLQLEAPTIETKQLEVRTRPGDTIRVPAYKGGMNPDLITIHGARFEHVAGPTRPIEGVVRDQDTGKPLAGIMVRGEHSLGNPIVYVNSISDTEGHYRLVGLPRGREGNILAVPPCDFPVHGSLKADLKVPRDEELPYLPARMTIAETRETGPVHLDIKMKRGVWVTGRVIDRATGKPVHAYIHYFAYLDNPALKAFAGSRLCMDNYHFTRKDGTFTCVAFPGSGVLAARAYEDRYVFGAGIEIFKHKPENGLLSTVPYHAVPTNYHVLAEIDPAEGTATLNRDLLLETGRSLTVTTLGPDGKPLTDMKIAGLRELAYWETPPSDASKHTIISLKPGKGRVLTFLNEKRRLIGHLALRGDEAGPQTVTLQPWGILTGRVVNGDAEPWGECHLYGVNLPEGYPHVGKDGRFRVEGLIPNHPYDLRILSSGSQLGGFIAKGLKLSPGETIDLHDVVPKNADNE